MSIGTSDKLNHLQRTVPEGIAIPSTWFAANNYSPQLVRKYVQSRWLQKLGSRVYARPGTRVDWEGVLLGLQRLGNVKLHLGGLSALNKQGLAHHLPLGSESTIHIWGTDKPPGWINTLDLNIHWAFHNRSLFTTDPAKGWVNLPTRIRDWTLLASAPERALLELLSEVDETVSSFTFAAEIFEGLTSARPSIVSSLLQSCKQAKAKRLFLFLADYYQYPWAKRVDTSSIDLGKGKRMITRSGRFDKRYQITIPETFYAG